MLICCPKCKSRYNIDDSLISEFEKKARCYKCETIFSVRIRERAVTEERVASHAGGHTVWEKESQAKSFLDQLEIPEDLKSQGDIYNNALEEREIEDFFSSSDDLAAPPDKSPSEISEKEQSPRPPLADEGDDEETPTGNGEELSEESSGTPGVSKSGIILEKDVDNALSDGTGKLSAEDELDMLLNESEISSVDKLPSDEIHSPPDNLDTGSQEAIDQIFEDAKTTPADASVEKGQLNKVMEDNSPGTVSNDDIDAILQQAKKEASTAGDSQQESIDQILEDAKNPEDTQQIEDGGEKDVHASGDSPGTVSNDDIDAILQQAKKEASSAGDSQQESIDQILEDAKNPEDTQVDENSSPASNDEGEQKEVSADTGILTEDMLEELLSGEGGQDHGGMLPETAGEKPVEKEETEKEVASTDNAANPSEDEAENPSGNILSEADLESLLSGSGGDDPGFMADRISEGAENAETEEVMDDTPETLDDMDKTVAAGLSGQDTLEEAEGDDTFDDDEPEDDDAEGARKKRGAGIRLLFLPFLSIGHFLAGLKGNSSSKRGGTNDEEGEEEEEEEEDEDEIETGADNGEESDDIEPEKGRKKKRSLRAKYIAAFFAVSVTLALATLYITKKHSDTQTSTKTDPPQQISIENGGGEMPKKPSETVAGKKMPAQEKTTPMEEKKPVIEEMPQVSDTVSLGLVLPVYRDPENFKVLDMIIKIIFDSSKTAGRVRDNLPYYEMKIEEGIDFFFSDKFYNDIPFVKNRLRKALKSDISKMVKFGKVKQVRIKFLKIKKREPDIDESTEKK